MREGIIAQPAQPRARGREILNLSAMNQIPAFKIFPGAKAPNCRRGIAGRTRSFAPAVGSILKLDERV
ncbi:hypothetical protein DC083_08945 [Ignatzschineria ureiclastica]|uniref:Uncharacterized protein n=1 Tax=Ignatzschineria ureiclastica TaxID=472582 RepID=A0A2U2ACQ0_9GAMM|nr:hypothetical protein [Ignatzschineria ureiclastica]PWD80431.1 hypothetical protein DC083_08945 [Ignatzschineria ureiclastica]